MFFDCFVWSGNSVRSVQYAIVAREISVLQNFVEHHYIKRIKIGCPGLRIYLIDEKSKEGIDGPIKGVLSWVNFFMYFDFEYYLSLKNNLEKKKAIIAMFKEGFYRAAAFKGWNMDPLIDAFNQIDALNYHFVNTSTRKRLKGVKRYVHLETECEPGFYYYFLAVKEKDVLISRHQVVTLNAFYNISFFGANRIVSEMRWEDANTFIIVGKKGHLERIRFEYKVDSDQIKTIINLEPDVNEAEFMEEFDLATTEDRSKIELILSKSNVDKWHIYV